MYIAMLRQLIYVAFISISLVSCGGTSTDTTNLTEDFTALNDGPTNNQDDSPTSSVDDIAPTVPANLRTASAPQITQVSLVWDESSDNVAVVAYRVYRNSTLLASVTTNTYVDTTVQPDTSYVYQVLAVDAADNQAASNLLSTNTPVATDTVPPTAPGNVQFSSVTSSSLTVSWTASTDDVSLSGYRVYRNGSLVAVTPSLSFNDSGLSGSTSYSYVVQAYDSSNNVASADAANVTTQAASLGETVTVTWQDPTRNTDDSCLGTLQGYTLHYGNSSGSYDQSVDLLISGGDVSCTQTSYDNACSTPIMTCSYVTEQLPPETWYFSVQAYDAPGNLSAYSSEAIKVIN